MIDFHRRGPSRRRGTVRIDGAVCGLLEETQEGVRFVYRPEWLRDPAARAVSLTLPLRPEPYVWERLHPFFENLLPEGWLLEAASRKLKLSSRDAFGLLLATCGDCVGAVEVFPFEEDARAAEAP